MGKSKWVAAHALRKGSHHARACAAVHGPPPQRHRPPSRHCLALHALHGPAPRPAQALPWPGLQARTGPPANHAGPASTGPLAYHAASHHSCAPAQARGAVPLGQLQAAPAVHVRTHALQLQVHRERWHGRPHWWVCCPRAASRWRLPASNGAPCARNPPHACARMPCKKGSQRPAAAALHHTRATPAHMGSLGPAPRACPPRMHALPCTTRRHLGYGGPGAVQQPPRVVLLPRARVHHGF